MLFLIIDHFQYRLAYCFQRILIYMLHIVIDGMPCRSKVTLLIIWNNIDCFNTCQAINEQMVVGNKSSVTIHERLPVANLLRRFLDFLIYIGSKFFRISLFHKHATFTAHHIEQDAKTCIISLYMRIACPIL